MSNSLHVRMTKNEYSLESEGRGVKSMKKPVNAKNIFPREGTNDWKLKKMTIAPMKARSPKYLGSLIVVKRKTQNANNGINMPIKYRATLFPLMLFLSFFDTMNNQMKYKMKITMPITFVAYLPTYS